MALHAQSGSRRIVLQVPPTATQSGSVRQPRLTSLTQKPAPCGQMQSELAPGLQRPGGTRSRSQTPVGAQVAPLRSRQVPGTKLPPTTVNPHAPEALTSWMLLGPLPLMPAVPTRYGAVVAAAAGGARAIASRRTTIRAIIRPFSCPCSDIAVLLACGVRTSPRNHTDQTAASVD